MAPEPRPKEGTGARSEGVSRSPLRFFNVPVDVAAFTAFFLLSWQAGSLPFWEGLQSTLGFNVGENFVNCPGRSPFLGRQEEAFNMTSQQAKLVTQIRLNAASHLIQPCVKMVLGEEWFDNTPPLHAAFAQGHQDWVMYHSFFSHMEYGEGFYVDVGANDPIVGSNTFFFDACLGWEGLCLEPNPMYVESFRVNRTCVHVKNCVGPEEAELTLSADKGSKGQVSSKGKGTKVLCRPLQDMLAEHKVGMTHKGQRRIDFASLDIEGFEYISFRCFPFDLFDIPVWLIETAHQGGYSLARMMARAGYWMSPQLLVHWNWKHHPPHGFHMDNLFVRWSRPKWMYALNATAAAAAAAEGPSTRSAGEEGTLQLPSLVLGPDFLPGGVLEGESYVAPCSSDAPSDCPEQVPAVEDKLEYKDGTLVSGECKAYDGLKHRLSNPI